MPHSVNKPTILIIPGSFSPAHFYHGIVNGLEGAGYEAFVYDLPSASRKPPQQAATLADDSEFFHHKASLLADQVKDVVLLPHSYGGLVASECVKGLSRAEREEASKQGCVSKIVFLTSVIPAVGESLQSLMGTLLPEFIKVDGDFMYHEATGSARINLSDLPYEKGIKLAAQFSHHSTRSFQNKLTYAGYRYIPSAFIMCDRDVVLPPSFQKSRVELLERECGTDVKVVHCNSGHCPNLSMPEAVAALVQEVLKD